ncbi:MAG: hypothetical protein IJC71_02930 [Clostridia bacterium]|nr:hypothetical protein [Clostridia bacterium]
MGFGTLFFGYFAMFAFSLAQAYFFADIIGALVAIYAFSKLAQYNRWFINAMAACLGFMILCGVSAASLMFRIYDPAGPIDMAVDIAKEAAACLMHIFMFLGTRGIAGGADAKKLVDTANRNLTLTMTYYAASLLVILFSGVLADEAQFVSMIVFLYWIVCLVLNLVLIYKCFGILCPADEDEDAPPKRSKIELINKINDKFEAMEQDKQKYREESMRLALEEAEKRSQEKQKKHQHYHKKK